jgi:hypothetical protein
MGMLEIDDARNWAHLEIMAWWKTCKLETRHSEIRLLLLGMLEFGDAGNRGWISGMLETAGAGNLITGGLRC